MTITNKIILKKGKEYSIERFHPWIFSGAIQKMEGSVTDGCWVEVLNFKNKTLGFGHYQNGSIAVRMVSFGEQVPAENFWETKLSSALKMRNNSGLPAVETNAFRLIHGEGDGLPGLIIDYYNGAAVLQAHDVGMHNDRQKIAQALVAVLGDTLKTVYYKSHGTLPGKLRDAQQDEYLYGSSIAAHAVTENGNKFLIDWEEGQKTGFFLDQRENRKLLGDFSKGKKVLNTFCYTGGFSVYALHAGAELVHSVDASEKAIALTRKNLELNGYDPNTHACFAEDTFDFLKDKQNEYDVIVLDPPAFAKHRDARHQAVKGYQRLNTEAMKKIKPGGIIFTFSCSQVVDRQLFYDTIVSAAIQASRQIKVLHHLSQPADHPVSIFHPEGEYLKGLVLYVE
ncbi:class I SAM-dependent rRNA methyltransferase [Ohtaekwangia koreensis]|uniref:23S rRNA (Cytosine1962-C5)-methyltransferase n=1 Tax=Ohtaekwangia koreensis TaxID=688867 RepID=A0A1T5LHR2_9BACT|nr:class I SAM-dependent rRNA methyltransferase [Ohtaekwangia koreensis]SKC75523.1 23S rRNA (cytosine1962-C5)-methyltransferase [Ohtaekwangia koreensis]